MADRTTKILLALIVLGLWGLLLRPVFIPIPTKAADTLGETPTIVVTDRGVYVSTRQGHVFLLDPATLAVKARAVYTIHPITGIPDFRNPNR